jgi:hypothetical protein
VTDLVEVRARKRSPYVGPRAIRDKEPFFGRELEARALYGELLCAGVMLLHAPSGAGKTSLIQATLVPWCDKNEHLQACATLEPRFSALRVNLPPPDGLDVRNRYVFSLVNAIVGDRLDRRDAATMTLDEALTLFAEDAAGRQLVVIDQLEEALTLDPNDRLGQEEFFRQLGNALRSDRRWALLAIRDDYLGRLDRYRRFFPNELRASFGLDFLDADAAMRAVQGLAATEDVTFTDAAARRLVADLREVRAVPVAAPVAVTADADADPLAEEAHLYPYVEPVLLQVVCNNLWRILRKKKPDFREITESDLDEVRPYRRALASYYQAAVRKAAAGDADVERAVRDWIERELVTRQLTRRPTSSLPQVADIGKVLKELEDRYLVRRDRRPGGEFWELSHDLLVEPVLEDNEVWRLANLESWQVVAAQWYRSGRKSGLLLSGPELRLARASAAKITPSPVERAFLDECRRRDDDETRRRRMEAEIQLFRYRVSTYRVALVCSLVLNAIVVVVFVLGRLMA